MKIHNGDATFEAILYNSEEPSQVNSVEVFSGIKLLLITNKMDKVPVEPLMFDNETLDVDEFLYDVSLHLRRRDIRTLLLYLGMPTSEIDELLSENHRMPRGRERGMLTSNGLVIDGGSAINFLEQRKRAIRAWWFYAANTNLRTTPSQQNVKIVESRASSLPGIKEEKEGSAQMKSGNISTFTGKHQNPEVIVSSDDPNSSKIEITPPPIITQSLFPPVVTEIPGTPPLRQEERHVIEVPSLLPSVTSGAFVQIPSVEVNDSSSQTQSETHINTSNKRISWGRNPELLSDREVASKVTVSETGVTLEELLRKLWRCLQSCGLSRVVEELQQRWMIRVDTKQRKADMFPKMTWGTPPPPQTSFTYPPYKNIGHMAVLGATMSIEERPLLMNPTMTSLEEEVQGANRSVIDSSRSEKMHNNSIKSDRSVTSSMDNISCATSFPSREAWKMRTDTVRRRGGTLTAHVLVDHVVLPSHLVDVWGSSLHVSQHQMREKATRVFLGYVTRDGRDLCRAVDRMERIRGLVVENAVKRIVNSSMSSSSFDNVGSELVIQCRCLYPETVEQLWLWYQSGQLRESVQAGLVTKRSRHACAVEQIQLRVYIAEEEYRRALGLLRRKPMPNTKTGRYYVTSGTGGVTGGTSGLTRPQRQALISVTRYLRLPAPSPSKGTPRGYFGAISFPPSGGLESEMRAKTVIFGGKRTKSSHALVDKILHKEVLSLRQRVRMCEDEWCEFAARDLAIMLRCARNVIQRRILGVSTREQLTPKCTSLSILRALHKALMSRAAKNSSAPTPRGIIGSASLHNVHSSISLYPSEIAFSNTDLVTTSEDDDHVVKARKQEERDYASAFAHFADLVSELSSCRNLVQEKIISRLTTNPTVAHSKQLYLTKDIYSLTERWRMLVSKNFNLEHDPVVQLLSKQILEEPSMTTLVPSDLQEQFPGFIGLLPATFQVADQVLEKLQKLLTGGYGASVSDSMVYPTIRSGDGHQHTISVRVVV